MRRLVVFPVFLIVALEAVIAAQTSARAPQTPSESYSAGATAVLVDVVVRNKQDQPLHGLTAHDFEIFEDGVRQIIGSLSVSGWAAGSARLLPLTRGSAHRRRPPRRPNGRRSLSCSTR